MRPFLVPSFATLGLLLGCVPPPDTGEEMTSATSPATGSGETESEAGGECGDLDCSQLDRADGDYPSGPYGSEVGDRLANSDGLQLKDCDGNVHDFAEFFGEREDGKYNRGVLINIGAGWCGPCQEETVEFPELYEEYHEQGIEIVQVLFQDWASQTPTSQFCEDWRTGNWEGESLNLDLPFPVFIDQLNDWTQIYLQDPQAATPINMLLDANANIRFKTEGRLVPSGDLRTQFDLVIGSPYEIPN